jgi:LPS biosynthesis protein
VRHKGFIPWDDDIDFGMFRNDYEKFLSICDHLDSRFFFVENFRNRKFVDNGLTRIYFKGTYVPSRSSSKISKELYCDVFPLDYIPVSEKERLSQARKISKIKKLLYLKTIKQGSSFSKTALLLFAKILLSPISTQFLARVMDYTASKKYQNVDKNFVCSMMSQYSYEKQTMPSSFYQAGKLLPFENKLICVPADYIGYLTHLYGPNYMIPKQRKGQSEQMVAFVDDSILCLLTNGPL